MDIAVLLGRLIVAGVFVVAGIAKLADRDGSRKAIIGFGLPAAWAASLGLLVPCLELVVALSLLVMPSALWGGLGAVVLLAAFSSGIAINLLGGHTPDCHCFGQLQSAPIGMPTLYRNAALLALAGLVTWQGRGDHAISLPQAIAGLSTELPAAGFTISLLALCAVVAQTWMIFHLLRQNGRMVLRMDALENALKDVGGLPLSAAPAAQSGLPVGSAAPSFDVALLSGGMTSLDRLRSAGNAVLLVFSDPSCSPCNALMPDVARWEQRHADALTVAVVSRGSVESNRLKAAEFGASTVLLQRDRELNELFMIQATPSAVLVTADGSVGSLVAMGGGAIAELVSQATGASGRNAPQASRIGRPIPEFSLPDLKGVTHDSKDLRGQDTLLLFWNPDCGYCKRMLPDVAEFLLGPSAPRLVVISRGSIESNQEFGPGALVLLDQTFSVGPQFGVQGTPSGILVNVKGLIASDAAVGAPAVLGLVEVVQPSAMAKHA